MRIYNRGFESELTRFLINENYNEQTEYQEDLEELKIEFFRGFVAKFKEDNNWTKFLPASDIEYDKRVVDKVERVMEEMREGSYDDYLDELIEDANYRDGEGII